MSYQTASIRKGHIIVWILCLCATMVTQVSAGTINAASCSQADVQAAVFQAKDGDTVQIPAGSATWRQTLIIATPKPADGDWRWPSGDAKYQRRLTLKGAGMDQTIITDSIPVANEQLAEYNYMSQTIVVYAKPGGITRITGMTLSRAPKLLSNSRQMLQLDGNSNTWRVDHLHFIADNGKSGIRVGGMLSGGVIDHNTFDLTGWTYGVYGFNGGDWYGDYAWSQPSPAGTAIPYFIEDNVFRGTTGITVAHDGWCGERVVFRHNTCENALFANHGTESSGRGHGARFSEVYDNIFTFTLDANSCGARYLGLRGGNGIYFNNTATGRSLWNDAIYRTIPVAYFRDGYDFQPFSVADGNSPWDLNDPLLYDSGTVTSAYAGAGAWNVLKETFKNWTPNQWVGYSVRNITQGFGSFIHSNGPDSIVFDDNFATSHGTPRSFNPGDKYEIRRVLAGLDQTGRGQGDSLGFLASDQFTPINSSTGTASWPRQVPEPSYAWNNTYNSLPVNFLSQSYHIIENRDFFNRAPQAGDIGYPYATYTYPHPLTQGNIPFSSISAAGLANNSPHLQVAANSLNGSIAIRRIGSSAPKSLKIYNLRGQEVADLTASLARKSQVQWDAGKLTNGVYLVRAKTGGYVQTARALLQREYK